MTDERVLAERQRCAAIADDLAAKWEATADKVRERGKTRFFWIGKPYTTPAAERCARDIEAAASGLRAVSMLIREGAVPKSVSQKLLQGDR